MPAGAITAHGVETYDAVVIVALAAQLAGSDDSADIAAQINGITTGDTKCTTFTACTAIIDDGGDPDYDGLGGPYEFVEAGEPSVVSFRIQTYGPGGRDESADQYIFTN